MKVVILAGGFGTRLSERTESVPKPMVEIGGKPILWHIMKLYAHYGHRDFVIALGYKGDVIKRYFLDYYNLSSDLRVNLGGGGVEVYEQETEEWHVDLIDTGLETNTGGRLRRLADHVKDETFLLTYGDGVSNVDVKSLVSFHHAAGGVGTITAVRPPARFGGLDLDGDSVREFTEKPQVGEGWINGGFMVLEPAILEYLQDDDTSLESDALEALAREDRLSAFRHESYWQCMDTLREVRLLEHAWQGGNAPWKTWS
jgi:glucose-1-phosphate cytidylyltransferase